MFKKQDGFLFGLILLIVALLAVNYWAYDSAKKNGVTYTQSCHTSFVFGARGEMVPVVNCIPIPHSGDK